MQDLIFKKPLSGRLLSLPFESLLEAFKGKRPRRGQFMQGRILQIEEDAILMDVGAKRDAVIPRWEIDKLDSEQLENLKPGDQLPVYVLKTPIGDENLLVSIKRGLEFEEWDRAKACLSSGKLLDIEVTGLNRGGLMVQFEQIQGFVPNSHIPGLKRGMRTEKRNAFKLEKVGTMMPLKFIEVNRNRRRLILSGRAAEKEKRIQRLHELDPGQVILGRVLNIVEYGAFVDLNGVDGLVHISELDWRRVKDPSEVVSIGDEVEVMVKEVDVERERVSLSRKALLPSPWDTILKRYKAGDLVEGEITNVRQFGAFVMLSNGIEGLIHESELGIVGPVHPQDVLSPGEIVIVRIIDIDTERKRMGLSLQQVSYDEQVDWIKQKHDSADSVKDVDIKDFSLLGATYNTSP
jgi:small subunit ribosomal protein S1